MNYNTEKRLEEIAEKKLLMLMIVVSDAEDGKISWHSAKQFYLAVGDFMKLIFAEHGEKGRVEQLIEYGRLIEERVEEAREDE